jgi:hypothetical protein
MIPAQGYRFYRYPGDPSSIRWLSTALRMKKGLIKLNGVAAVRLLSAMDHLCTPFCRVTGVIKSFCHGCSPLYPDSIFIT